MTDDVATRVARGVALLDERKPGWVGLIDLSQFDISTCDRCVLGQVYRVDEEDLIHHSGFGWGSKELDINGFEGEYGFDNYIDDYSSYIKDEFPELQKEWVRVIGVLRQQRIDTESSTEDEVLVRTLETLHG